MAMKKNRISVNITVTLKVLLYTDYLSKLIYFAESTLVS